MSHYSPKKQLLNGFSLVEMAIVLVILGFVLAALLLPLQAQRQQLAQSETENTLALAQKALLGYAQSQARLPCPATSASNGLESITSGVCTQQVGFLPSATLGIQPTDINGFALDAWNNRILYAVTTANTNAFITATTMSNIGIANLTPDLRVCASATAANCTASINLTNNAVAVIYSLGATGSQVVGGADEIENQNAIAYFDKVFVSHDPTGSSAVNGKFDHLVVWISPYVLYNAMIEAGQLH